MTNQSQCSNMATEYEVVQRQRMQHVSLMHQWGLGLISVAAVVLSAFILFGSSSKLPTELNGGYLHIGLALVFFILYLWRFQAHQFDDRVKELYYNIVRLEEKLGFNFYQRYLKRRAPFDKLGYYRKSSGKMSDFIHKYYDKHKINIFGERGHRSYDALVVAIGIIVVLLIFWLALPLVEFLFVVGFTLVLLFHLGKMSFEKDTLGYCNKVRFRKNFKVYFKLFRTRKRREFPQRIKDILEESKPKSI